MCSSDLELLSVPTDTPSIDELQALPYLDAVVRETMRLYAPVEATIRTAGKDDMIPLSTPYTDTRGITHDSIKYIVTVNIQICSS